MSKRGILRMLAVVAVCAVVPAALAAPKRARLMDVTLTWKLEDLK